MPLIWTDELRPNSIDARNDQIYNGLDSALTLEILFELRKLFNEPPQAYSYERALQGPLLEIMLRGFAVDETDRQAAISGLRKKIERLQTVLDKMAFAVWDKPLNPRSFPQLKDFFYTSMRLPEEWISDKGQRKLSFKREVLEKLEVYFHAMPIIATILAIRDYAKQLEFLLTEVNQFGRMTTSYNIGGTDTWRLSSSSDAFGSGGNLQNWSPELRRVLVADPGKKLCVMDLEQAESREVGLLHGILFGDWTYLNACESGDLHSTTARMVWKDLPWTGDRKEDRKIAEKPFYRRFSYRDMSKRGGHASSYYATAWTISRHLKIPLRMAQDFQNSFFGAFPAFEKWFRWTAQEIQTKQKLTTTFGLTRHFFSRPGDDTTLRAAIAHTPQSNTAIRTNLGLYRIWDQLREAQLLAQTHDSVTFQYDENIEQEIVPKALRLMSTPLERAGRIFDVPSDAKVGWNWAPCDKDNPEDNPNGLKKFSLEEPDKRTRLTGLNRPF